MHRLHRIGGVDDLLHIVRVFEVGRQGGPLVALGGDDQGIFAPHFASNSSSAVSAALSVAALYTHLRSVMKAVNSTPKCDTPPTQPEAVLGRLLQGCLKSRHFLGLKFNRLSTQPSNSSLTVRISNALPKQPVKVLIQPKLPQ